MPRRKVCGVVLALIVGGLVPTTVRAQCLEWNGLGPPGTYVRALAVFDGGSGSAELYAAGNILPLSGGGSTGLAKWTGGSWSPVGGAAAGGWALAVHDDGSGPSLFVAGAGVSAPGFHAVGIARWDGTSWHALGSGLADDVHAPSATALAVFDDGTGRALYVAGDFDSAGGVQASNVARWDGSSWSALGAGTNQMVFALTTFDDGSGPALYAAGLFTSAGGAPANRVARWDGAMWSPLGYGVGGFAYALASHDDGSGPALYAGGSFIGASGQLVYRVARWNGCSWSALDGYGVSGIVWTLLSFDDGTGPALFAGGEFTVAGGLVNAPANHVAKWNGTAWSRLASGTNGDVYALAAFDDGLGRGASLYVGGQFTTAGGVHGYGLARWVGCGGPGTLYCSGDGSTGACPCGNAGTDGRGCENSAVTGGALLFSAGSTSPDSVVLRASGMGPSATAIFLQGDATSPPQAFGDGLRCAGGLLKRLYVESAAGGIAVAPSVGEPTITQQSSGLGDPIAPGSMRHYQAYYRDASAAFCPAPQGNAWNVSNAVSIPW